MHVLNYLSDSQRWPNKDGAEGTERGDDVRVEYRLLCSGMLYPSHFLGDWSHSDVARVLLEYPVQLLVASQPYDQFPQELALRFTVSQVEERNDTHVTAYHPDREIASDLAALFTLLSRRLITISARTRQHYLSAGPPGPFPPPPSYLRDFPVQLVTAAKNVYWISRQIHSPKGYIHPFDSSFVMNVLHRLPALPSSKSIVRAARLYALAMEIIEQKHEIAYQLLISSIETMAGGTDLSWQPTREDQLGLQSSKATISTARSKGVAEDVAIELAIAACKDHGWKGQRFYAFIDENVTRDQLSIEDDLFWVPSDYCPTGEAFKRALKMIYQARGGATHDGREYPPSACIGPSPTRPIEAWRELMTDDAPFPPVGWFERVVNNAVSNYLRKQLQGTSCEAATEA